MGGDKRLRQLLLSTILNTDTEMKNDAELGKKLVREQDEFKKEYAKSLKQDHEEYKGVNW